MFTPKPLLIYSLSKILARSNGTIPVGFIARDASPLPEYYKNKNTFETGLN